MTLGELIARLQKEDPARVVRRGFGEPASYRGYYEQLAFAPAENVTVGSMLKHARGALGKTFQGWKGGDFTMREHTCVWIAERGHTVDDPITHALLDLMFSDAEARALAAEAKLAEAQAREAKLREALESIAATDVHQRTTIRGAKAGETWSEFAERLQRVARAALDNPADSAVLDALLFGVAAATRCQSCWVGDGMSADSLRAIVAEVKRGGA